MDKVTMIFVKEKNLRHPISGLSLSKNKRIESMYRVITDAYYDETFNRKEKLLAVEFIKLIINE